MGFNGVVSIFSSPGFWKTGTKKGYPTAPFCIHWESDKGPQGLGFCVRGFDFDFNHSLSTAFSGRSSCSSYVMMPMPSSSAPSPCRNMLSHSSWGWRKGEHCLVANGFKSYFSCSCFLQLLCARCAVSLCGSFAGPKVGVLVQQGQQLSMLLILERV